MLLVEEARSTFISKDVNGGETCILMLEVSYNEPQLRLLLKLY